MVQFHHRFGDAHPQPQAAKTSGLRLFALLKGVENPGHHLHLDADAGIGDFDLDPLPR